MKAKYKPALDIPYPEVNKDNAHLITEEDILDAERYWMREYPRRWLKNLERATESAQSVDDLRQVVSELIYILQNTNPTLKWNL